MRDPRCGRPRQIGKRGQDGLHERVSLGASLKGFRGRQVARLVHGTPHQERLWWADRAGYAGKVSPGITLEYNGRMATSLKIDPALKERVKLVAEAQRRTPHWVMLQAIEQYVERQEARESFRQEAMASWTAYKETGRHLTGAEVSDWLGKWGTPAETDLPECRD